MSDQKREELKAKINEKLDELSLEVLEQVAGGGIFEMWTCPICGATMLKINSGTHYCTGKVNN